MDACGTANSTICDREQVHIGRNQLSDGSFNGGFAYTLLRNRFFGKVFENYLPDFSSFGGLSCIIACFSDVWDLAFHQWSCICEFFIGSDYSMAGGSYFL